MSLSENHVKILGAISMALGLALLITSSLIVDDYKDSKKRMTSIGCKLLPEECKNFDFRVAAGALGIIGALVQITSFAMAWMKKAKVYCGLHLVTFLATLIAFSLAIDSGLNNVTELEGYKARGLAFISIAAIDAIYSLGITGAAFLA